MDNNNAPCTWCGHTACSLDTMHVEHACQQCWDNQKQLDELKEANELKKKTIETLIAIREAQDRFYGFEPTAKRESPDKPPYPLFPKPAGKGVIVSEPRQRD